MTTPPLKSLKDLPSDYDPNSMPVEKARQAIRSFLSPVTAIERLPIRSALGRILALPVVSTMNVPAHDNSAMDGYAMRHSDLAATGETTLRIAGSSFAGKPFTDTLGPGEAVRIMTGAVIPSGTDVVVMQERARVTENRVSISAGQQKGQNLRYAGEDLKQGQVVFDNGQMLRPAELGMIASLGIGEVSVYRKLRVAFFSTGNELVSIGGTLGPGQIFDSNRYTLFGMLTRLGCEVLDMGVIRDDPAAIEDAFSQAASAADVVITSGGVSVGEADFVRQMLDRLGDVLFWKIAMKPGRPLAYGKIGQAHFFGLPGNPVAVMVTFYQFVREALLILMGRASIEPLPTLKVKCSGLIRKAPGRTEFQRGILSQGLDGEWTVQPTGDQGSGILSSMSRANCFIVLPSHQGGVDAGSVVDVQLLEGLV
jgi:molybdopterin molybdotransferase